MNDICLAAHLETVRNDIGDHEADIRQPSDGEPCHRVYFQSGRRFTPADPAALNLKDALPPGTYTIGRTETGFFLEQLDNFSLPTRLYGDVDANARRILNTFLGRPSGTGVLLSGNKGSGKTMLAKRIAQLARSELGLIAILISRPLCGEEFNLFLQGIQQPAVVIFDEFEKVYDREAQPKLLTVRALARMLRKAWSGCNVPSPKGMLKPAPRSARSCATESVSPQMPPRLPNGSSMPPRRVMPSASANWRCCMPMAGACGRISTKHGAGWRRQRRKGITKRWRG